LVSRAEQIEDKKAKSGKKLENQAANISVIIPAYNRANLIGEDAKCASS
jgi:hypothetical protein